MNINTYLLQLTLTDGLTYKNKTLILNWILKHKNVSLPLTLNQLFNIILPSEKQITAIESSYHTKTQFEKMKRQFKYITIIDDVYPTLLKESYQPPLILFYEGNINLLNIPLVAMVGARKSTNYSKQILDEIIPNFSGYKIGVVSGLAMGVDYLTHQKCLEYNVFSIGVIGTSLDVFYPKTSKKLQIQVAQKGLLISQYPSETGPKKHQFPQRNKIIASLCQTTVVVEAAKNSGSLITANFALQENRNVLAIPGAINAPMSIGCNELIQNGAGCVLNAENILQEMRVLEL